jgi:putative inorganic carbon (hco3(-)) transporter
LLIFGALELKSACPACFIRSFLATRTMLRFAQRWLQLPSVFERPSNIWIFLALSLSVASVLVSIAVSQILLAAALIGWIWKEKRTDLKPMLRLPLIPPLCAFALWTIISALISPNSIANLLAAKKFYLYLLLLLVPAVVRGQKKVLWVYKAIFAVSAISGIAGLIQFLADPKRDYLHRISGFMSHWMTYAGLLMLVLILLTNYALNTRRRDFIWIIPLGCLIAVPLVLSDTRTAWAGTVAGALVVILLRKPRAIIVLFAITLAVYLVSPAKTKQRLESSWNLKDPNTKNRIEIWGTSWRLIKHNPWFGVGLKNVNREALQYRGNHDYPDWAYQHAHNNFLQIAVERGIPGLLFWIWLMIRLGWDALRVYRVSSKSPPDSKEARIASVAALGALAALLVAGLGEYNFGDSEILTLFLFIMSAPYTFLIRIPVQGSPFPVQWGTGNGERGALL